MLNVLSRPEFYICLPFLVQVFFLSIFFNVPPSLYLELWSIALPILFFCFFCFFLRRKLNILYCIKSIYPKSEHRLVLNFFVFMIVVFGILDLYFNGIKILNPSTYAELPGLGRYIRHFSSMCWVLIPISIFCIKSKKIRVILTFWALIFPILSVDRNRLLLSLYVLVFFYFVYSNGSKKWAFNAIFVFLMLFLFGLVGQLRSGDSFFVSSSGVSLLEGSYPLKDIFLYVPSYLQQIILYLTTPLVNFMVISEAGFINTEFLLSQFSPFSRSDFPEYPFAPFLVPRYNVGTEFFPFLTWGGSNMVIVSIFLMLLVFVTSIAFLRKTKNVFSLVIFFKISHTVLFMGFAPQFFILLNLMFIVVFLFLWFISSLAGIICRTSMSQSQAFLRSTE